MIGVRGAAAVTAALVLVPPALAGAETHPQVSCRYSDTAHALRVTIRDERERIDFPPGLPPHVRHEIREELERFGAEAGSAGIERRGEQLTVLRGLQGPPVACKGPPPTIDNTDSISVALGRQSESAELLIDFLHGALAPGFTDEGDGTSEIEIDADIGEGQLYLRGSRDPESVTVSANGGGGLIDFGGQPESQPDIAVPNAGGMILDTVGGDDSIAITGKPFSIEPRVGGTVIIGGQGSDSLTGGPGAEGLVPGPGVDSVDAGGGRDVVLSADRGRDRIDCGPGWDRLFAVSDKGSPHDCERVREAPFGALLGYSIELFIEESEYSDVAVVSTTSAGRALRR